MSIVTRLKEARARAYIKQQAQRERSLGKQIIKGYNQQDRAQAGRDSYGKFRSSRYGAIQKRFEQATNRKITNRPRFQRYRARTQRVLATAYGSQSNRPSKGRVKYGRGRPKGTFKYFIPGRGPVDVFTWRRYVREVRRRQIAQATLQAQGQYSPQVQSQYPQVQQQVQLPPVQSSLAGYSYNQPQPVAPVTPQLKEISIIERTPLTMGMVAQEQFIEQDLMSGKPKVATRGFLW